MAFIKPSCTHNERLSCHHQWNLHRWFLEKNIRYRIIVPGLGKDAADWTQVEMCKCAKKKEFKELLLDVNLSWQCLQKISLPAICQLMLGFRSSHSLHCNALSATRKSPGKKLEQADLWKSRTMTDAIRMAETNSWKWPTFGSLWPTERRLLLIHYLQCSAKYDIFEDFVFDLVHV